MKPRPIHRLITTADGEIVYDPPHVHHIIFRNDLEAWCCSTRGTPAGRIGPVTHISPGSGPALLIKTQKRQKALREAHIRDSKSAREKAGGIPTTGFLNQGAAATPISNRADYYAATKGSGSDAVGENGANSPEPCPTEGGRVEGPGATLQSQTPPLQSMNGPSGKTATKSETVPTTPSDGFPPTHATADLVACGDAVMGAREVTTVNGRTCVLTTGDGTDYWGSQLLLSQLEKNPDLLPDIVVEVVSKSGRMYRTFSKAKGSPARTFGRLGGE